MKVLFVSLGCDKNLVDSEKMIGILGANGYTVTDDEEDADICIVNTCCFIGDAKEESINTILSMAAHKKDKLKVLVVAGCLAQRYADEIREDIPEVDAIVGTSAYDAIADAVKGALSGEKKQYLEPIDRIPVVREKRVLSTIGNHYAYLKIAEGCEKFCTYCIIPKIRGKYRSIPMEDLVEEAKELANQGVKELILIAQETTLYGVDLYKEKSLHILIKELAKIEGIRWIRLQYCYPEEIYDGLIECMKTEKKLVHYLDMPIQHCNDRILKLMGRRTTKEDLTNVIAKLRREVSDIVLRTTLITGFPSETDEEFEELLDFVDEMEFDRLGAFAYSPEEGTPAESFEGQIDEDTKTYRRDQVMGLSSEIAAFKSSEKIGKTYEVIVDGYMESEGAYVGRTYMDAPGVDGVIFLEGADGELMAGDYVEAKVKSATDYDLDAVITDYI